MKLPDVSPAIIDQINQEPEEAFWFVWDRNTDMPWWDSVTGHVRAFAFESDALYDAVRFNGRLTSDGRICDGYPRQATLKEAKAARTNDRPIALFDRDLNVIRRLG